MKIYDSLQELIGNTPLVHLKRLYHNCPAMVAGKVEFFNPASSVKDRIALAMIEDAEKCGILTSDSVIIEPTSGNTGIALAWVSAIKGYRLFLTMPETMSTERRKLLKHLGAEIILTPGTKGMKGAVEEAQRLSDENGYVMLQQFKNPANPAIHRTTTAEEIWKDTDGAIDILISGVGTGGSITGISETLKAKKPSLHVCAVEPEESSVLSGNPPGPHGIQGIGAGFIPDVLNTSIIDEIIQVNTAEALEFSKKAAQHEGLLLGISCGAALKAADIIARRPENNGKLIVCILPDGAERYISTKLFEQDS